MGHPAETRRTARARSERSRFHAAASRATLGFAVLVAIHALVSAPRACAAAPEPGNAPALPGPTSIPQDRMETTGHERDTDYFDRYTNPAVRLRVENYERYHLTESTFWRWYRNRAFDYARGEVEFVLSGCANHAGALHLMELVAQATQNASLPIPYYERAIELFPQHAYTHAQYGHYLVQIGYTAAGISELEEAVRTDPSLTMGRAWLAEARAAGSRGAGRPGTP